MSVRRSITKYSVQNVMHPAGKNDDQTRPDAKNRLNHFCTVVAFPFDQDREHVLRTGQDFYAFWVVSFTLSNGDAARPSTVN